MKKLFIPLCAGALLMLGSSRLMAQETAKALIINTSSSSEVNKILASLKDADPSTYRLTVSTTNRGKASSTVYGTAPLSAIGKVNGSTGKIGGGYAASDVIVAVKVITNGKDFQRDIISKLNKNLSTQTVKTVSTSALRGGNMR
ncbi:hypothetical protein SAMN06265348_104150 [Pedobacter westerhofensis]|uniref:CHRD domain-containing protein n=1 Tax=Pedobacter westerhofensis TaxID=425512 RepID=A0A521CUF6_9SPHI|nr:hypothetical protein [Pedobacter westerhofensis]SMO62361.1 hypothetical protein SAMN06265348_104150 [Pedobacter westerhofensis]